MTDKEIIQALNRSIAIHCFPFHCFDKRGNRVDVRVNEVIDLINRQQSEIERLQKIVNIYDKQSSAEKTEILEEFALDLWAAIYHDVNFDEDVYKRLDKHIDRILKGKIGDKND